MLLTALSEVLVDEILVPPVGLIKRHPCVVGQLSTNLTQLLLRDIINCLTADKRVLGKLLRFATGFSFAKSMREANPCVVG